ncbi:MAG: prolyl oligopeptidase family serine peptidase [Flavobacteriaceae bacterium]|nr:prolyl oligopeptidase family serine peptidase [Flavobacteriaceae bacterium]
MRIFFLLLVSTPIILVAQENTLYEHASFSANNDTLNYRVLKPKDFDHKKKYPLVLFMHGAGERGNDNKAQLVHGADLFAKKEHREKYNSFVIFPQCPENDYWSNINYTQKENGLGFEFKEKSEPWKALSLVMKLMDSLVQSPNIDTNRIYISGLSMGGMATFELLFRRPDMFAAAIPICGGAHPLTAQMYAKKVPVWVIHGSDDDVVNPAYSIRMTEAIKDAGGSPRLSLYDNTGHDSWTRAFAEPDFLNWLFSKSK